MLVKKDWEDDFRLKSSSSLSVSSSSVSSAAASWLALSEELNGSSSRDTVFAEGFRGVLNKRFGLNVAKSLSLFPLGNGRKTFLPRKTYHMPGASFANGLCG